MKRLVQYFVEGILVLAPLALTVYVVGRVLSLLESFGENFIQLGLPAIPGLGLLVTLIIITTAGFVASHWLAKRFIGALEGAMGRIPLIKSIYGSIKDVIDAFGGKKQSFSKVALVKVPGSPVELLGFITKEDMGFLGPEGRDRVSVYIPQSLQLGGFVAIVPKENVTVLDTPPQVALRFLMTAGMTEGGSQEENGGNMRSK